MIEFKAGDRVRYTGPSGQIRKGSLGTVKSTGDSGAVDVVFDDHRAGGVFWASATHLEPVIPTREELNTAIQMLNRAGYSVTKHFEPIVIKNATSDYDAAVYQECIMVQCQSISFEKFDEIAAAVAKARAFTGDSGL